jgi:chemotaxis family two-component system response regulator Rcp1
MIQAAEHRAVRVLLVEDNPADVVLLRQALADGDLAVELVVAPDGEAAVRAMAESVGEAGRHLDLVLLDLSLPRKSGIEVLAEVKSDPVLRRTPVIVLSGSAAERDVRDAYDRHANAYMRKPRDYQGLREIVRAIERFWLEQALLPA